MPRQNVLKATTNATFFPTGNVRPWTIPDELLEWRTAWAEELRRLYADPASWPGSLAPEVGLLLYAFIRNIRPQVIVETGTCLGASTIWMAAALRANGEAGKVYTLDNFMQLDERSSRAAIFQNRPGSVEDRFRLAGLAELIEMRFGDSATELSRLRSEMSETHRVQLAFIDADHSIKGALGDFLAVEPLLAVGGYIVLHDIFPDVCGCDGPAYVCQKINEIGDGQYELCSIYTAQTNYGIAISRRVK